MSDKTINDIVNDSKREGEKMLRDMRDARPTKPTNSELDEILARLVDMVHAKTLANPDKVNIAYNLQEATQSILALIHTHQQALLNRILEQSEDFERWTGTSQGNGQTQVVKAVPVEVIKIAIEDMNG